MRCICFNQYTVPCTVFNMLLMDRTVFSMAFFTTWSSGIVQWFKPNGKSVRLITFSEPLG